MMFMMMMMMMMMMMTTLYSWQGEDRSKQVISDLIVPAVCVSVMDVVSDVRKSVSKTAPGSCSLWCDLIPSSRDRGVSASLCRRAPAPVPVSLSLSLSLYLGVWIGVAQQASGSCREAPRERCRDMGRQGDPARCFFGSSGGRHKRADRENTNRYMDSERDRTSNSNKGKSRGDARGKKQQALKNKLKAKEKSKAKQTHHKT